MAKKKKSWFYRNVIAFDEHGKVKGQIEFSVGPVDKGPLESNESTKQRFEKFQTLAMQFLSGSSDFDDIEVDNS